MNTILCKLFVKDVAFKDKLLTLTAREFYSFTLNNSDRIKNSVLQAMATELFFAEDKQEKVITVQFAIPQELLFTYDGKEKSQKVTTKNVYSGYPSSAEIRFTSEKLFEKYCKTSQNVGWVYKNGDKGTEHFLSSIKTALRN